MLGASAGNSLGCELPRYRWLFGTWPVQDRDGG